MDVFVELLLLMDDFVQLFLIHVSVDLFLLMDVFVELLLLMDDFLEFLTVVKT